MTEALALLAAPVGVVALAVSLISGSLGGVGLAALQRSTAHARKRALLTGAVVLWLGALYWISLMVAIIAEGSPVPAFVAALAAIWATFSLGVTLGSYVSFRMRSQAERLHGPAQGQAEGSGSDQEQQ